MASSLRSTALRRGFAPPDVERLTTAFHLAMEPRVARLDDAHHPAFLHPGRVALILLNDVPEGVPTEAIVLGILIESRDADLRAQDQVIVEGLGSRTAEDRSSIPTPGAEDLPERLVSLPVPLLVAALSEHLDHLRHEHLRPPVTAWPDLVEEVAKTWLPVAERTSDTLGRRYRHWLRTFRRRL